MPINGGRAHSALRIESNGQGFCPTMQCMIDLRCAALREMESTPNGALRLRIQRPKVRCTS